AGQTYLIFGKPDGWAMRTSLSDVDASFVGEEREDWSGVTLSGAGDVNGDGYDDFLIGSFTFGPDFPDIKDHIGRVYLIFGKPDGWAMRTSLSEADVIYYGPVSKDWSGLALAGAGDVNSDGCDDFLIAAHWKDENWIDVSKVYLIFGTPEGWEKRVPMSESNVTFVASGWFAISGSWGLQHSWSVSGAGDVNGDGYDDILIGAAWDEEGGKEAGQTYLVFGRPGGLGGHVEIDILQGADASFIGEHPGYWSGFRVCGGADVNGDGYDDILIGASWSGHGGARAGETYLIYGKPNGWTKGVNLSQADISFLGEEPGDRSGYAISNTGDVNGDGCDDILIGVDLNSFSAERAGQTYLQCREERKGDVNFNGLVNVADVVLTVNILIRLVDAPPGQMWAADFNSDGTINVLDIVQIINIILED
ncbi:MAG: dockerin type I domain-containing protein, partial [bacterium]